jgi:hypothetical protein
MKSSKFLIIPFIAVLLFGCKNNKNDNDYKTIDSIAEEEAIDEVPNVSDDDFDNAIKAYTEDNKATAAKYIRDGVLALKAEGKDVGGLYKLNLDNAIGQLESIAEKLDEGYYISLEGLKEAIVNAEINIAHEYLSSTNDLYVLVRPKDVSSAITKRHFSSMLSNLKQEEETTKNEAKKDRDVLLKEGEALEKELTAWEAKANAYAKKTNEHFKVYYPNSNYAKLNL